MLEVALEVVPTASERAERLHLEAPRVGQPRRRDARIPTFTIRHHTGQVYRHFPADGVAQRAHQEEVAVDVEAIVDDGPLGELQVAGRNDALPIARQLGLTRGKSQVLRRLIADRRIAHDVREAGVGEVLVAPTERKLEIERQTRIHEPTAEPHAQTPHLAIEGEWLAVGLFAGREQLHAEAHDDLRRRIRRREDHPACIDRDTSRTVDHCWRRPGPCGVRLRSKRGGGKEQTRGDADDGIHASGHADDTPADRERPRPPRRVGHDNVAVV
jgi:hypothetical protein